MAESTLDQQTIIDAIRDVYDPDLKRSIVDLGFVKNVVIDGETVSLDIELTTPACPVKDLLKRQVHQRIAAMPGVSEVKVAMTSSVRTAHAGDRNILPGVKNTVAVASGKGGVGKSTTAVNLALALHESGAAVGLLDADVYGPSMAMMLGIDSRPKQVDNKLLPVEAQGLKVMSMAFLSDESTPIIWRGPMVHGLIQQFLTVVLWGELEYLVIDLPPGTGDAQLTLTQMAPLAGAVIVTTPQDVSLIDARKGLRMFQQVNVPVLGLVENMSYFVCPHCQERTEIFAHGGGRKTATELSVPFLGEIPIDPSVVTSGDSGLPILASHPKSASAEAYRAIAKQIAAQLSIQTMGALAVPTIDIRWEKDK